MCGAKKIITTTGGRVAGYVSLYAGEPAVSVRLYLYLYLRSPQSKYTFRFCFIFRFFWNFGFAPF